MLKKRRIVRKIFIFLTLYCHLIKSIPQERIITLTELETIKQQQNLILQKGVILQLSFEEAFWWHLFPLTGIFFIPPHYPYLPHAFSLWQLAPALGEGITVTFIDTGIFGWNLTTKETIFSRHPDNNFNENFLCESWNTCPFTDRLIDPFEDLVTFISSRTKQKDTNQIRQVLPLWIEEFLSYKTTQLFDTYIQKHGLSDLFISSGNLKKFSPEGKRVKKTLTHKEQGFGQFTLVTLESGKKAIREFMPLPSVQQSSFSSSPKPFIDHATHTTSTVGAQFTGQPFRRSSQKKEFSFEKCLKSEKGLCGLAPRSQIRIIKALQEGADTTTHVTHISNALTRAALYGTDIVNLSLQIDQVHPTFDKRFQQFEEQITQFPFLSCAAGNDRKTKQGILGYPARYKKVFFSVGSFGCTYNQRTKTYDCHISPFSQYEKGIGPHFIAPGEAVLGCSSATPGKDPLYALHTGTSYATAYLTGCLTLILGEHKKNFTPEEIMIVCQNSCFRLYNTAEWNENVTYGVLDTRTALFTLHVLKRLQKKYGTKCIIQNFKKLVESITDELLILPTLYAQEKKLTASFKESFIDYYNTSSIFLLPDAYQKKISVSLEDAIEDITKRIGIKHHFLSIS